MVDRIGPRMPVRLLAAALLLGGAVSACSPFDDLMVAVFGRSMRDQRSFDPYENTLLPPIGSVPFAAGNMPAQPGHVNIGQPEGAADLPPAFTQAELITQQDVVMSLVNPMPTSPESLARGQLLFDRFCAICHGTDGIGANAPIAEVHPVLPAYNVAGDRAAALTDGYIYGMIRVGRALMPAYGHRITHYDRWHIVNYVRQLQGRAGTNPGPEE